jgi:hypothetical protein
LRRASDRPNMLMLSAVLIDPPPRCKLRRGGCVSGGGPRRPDLSRWQIVDPREPVLDIDQGSLAELDGTKIAPS